MLNVASKNLERGNSHLLKRGERKKMKKIKQYQVGNLILRKQGNNLVFTGNKNARPPIQIVTAMIAVTKYLKWWDRDNLYDYVPIATVDLSATQRTIYVDGKKQ